MQGPFDIAADLDTPVSAYLKLSSLKPRFLLESVEGGERLARYSFLGFGNSRELRLDDDGLHIDGETRPRPANQREYLDTLREVLASSPRLEPQTDGLPFSGGLVGVSGYDVVRLFERLPRDTTAQADIPEAAFVAPASLLVFDHLTRRVALLHDGTNAEMPAPDASSWGASASSASTAATETTYATRVATPTEAFCRKRDWRVRDWCKTALILLTMLRF